ncbi:sorbitol dehydrogenase family protein [Microbulbifer celer]|uniref:Sorbitol dehydrogenase family protein n=1 Tax=Microbulbifer celer TaxID=435905 RepID=A0ABW3UAI9_9GAMM|nr:sorbitol dehydrogenase family protein [Microbulbifer celer]UFN57047.1 sorbitol dehydrogenase family protein [Microbulbifer celer]
MTFIRRRQFLRCQLLVGGGLLAGPILPVQAQQPEVKNAGQRLGKFFTLSQNLLAPLPIHTQLDKRVAARLLVILNRKYPDFPQQLDKISKNPSAAEQRLPIARHIIRAWYTGVIDGQLVTFERALMYRIVSDVLPVRTYCDGRPGDWASLPQPANRGV